MSIRISHDHNAPIASVELPILRPLADYDLGEIEMATPREVDPVLASQGFKDLLDEARSVFDQHCAGKPLEILQLTGAICHDGGVHRPGLWLVVRESGVSDQNPMSETARTEVAAIARALQQTLGIG
ncbi:MAG TPA: hypothetical protein VGS20_05620 [Candidatus Acidoferrales bacterium]|nr:hypothetical protein [Candidatus Acidoferrales bacterium]